jgi:hypothetical protein
MELAKKNVTTARLPAGGEPKLAQQPINDRGALFSSAQLSSAQLSYDTCALLIVDVEAGVF